MDRISEINAFLQQGRTPKVKELVNAALAEGIDPELILSEGLLAAMNVVGEKFKRNEVFVPEVLVSARAMNAGVEILRPYLVAAGVESAGKAIIGTVKGDLHDIGKNIVRMMLESKGIEVVDLGVDVTSDAFVEKTKEINPDVICCSALLTTTMNEIKNVVEALEKAGLRDKVKIMVGGAPVTQAFCDSVGADYYTADAASASDVALKVCKGEM
jgi:corrinoid protein of di/trimethylamine methyltransferase